MRSTFSIIFYLKRQAAKQDGTMPVMGRITVDGTQTQFSCKITVDPKLWDTRAGRATGRSAPALETNRMLDRIRVKINGYYHEIADRENFVTAEKVKNAFLGLEYRSHTLLKIFEQCLNEYEKLYRAQMRSLSCYRKYLNVYQHLKEFIRQHYNTGDIGLRELTPTFMTDFDIFLRSEKNCCNNTVWTYTFAIRKVIAGAVDNGWLSRNPFRDYRIKQEETTRGFLTREEIRLLMEHEPKNANQELIRDLFVFCCFTGVSFSDLRNLSQDNLKTYFDNYLWIHLRCQKTGVTSNIRLLDVPLKIIRKYEGITKDGKVFPVPSYSVCLHWIKVMGKQCGITKRISWHLARHTMATEVCLTNNVPIETVSSILGHKNIRTTQIYAKITKEKLNRDMANLSARLNNIEEYSINPFSHNPEHNFVKKEREVATGNNRT